MWYSEGKKMINKLLNSSEEKGFSVNQQLLRFPGFLKMLCKLYLEFKAELTVRPQVHQQKSQLLKEFHLHYCY